LTLLSVITVIVVLSWLLSGRFSDGIRLALWQNAVFC